jgi:hypothetical protein
MPEVLKDMMGGKAEKDESCPDAPSLLETIELD